MSIKYKYIFVTILYSLLLIFCATPTMVSEKSVEYLSQKYNEKFKVLSVDMNHDEGNRGSADLIISPESDSSLTFSFVYNYSDEKLEWENYKGALWNREIGNETQSLIRSRDGEVKVKAGIIAKGSITFNSMDLPYKKNYGEIRPFTGWTFGFIRP